MASLTRLPRSEMFPDGGAIQRPLCQRQLFFTCMAARTWLDRRSHTDILRDKSRHGPRPRFLSPNMGSPPNDPSPLPSKMPRLCIEDLRLRGTAGSQLSAIPPAAAWRLALPRAWPQRTRDSSLPSPVAVVAMSPWTDLALTGDSISARASHDPLLTADALEAARNLYLGSTDAHDPRASPLYGDMTNLPPVMLHVGEDEILLDDSRRYADSMKGSDGIVEIHVWRGMVHVFPANVSLLRAARSALDMSGGFLRQHLGVDQDTTAK